VGQTLQAASAHLKQKSLSEWPPPGFGRPSVSPECLGDIDWPFMIACDRRGASRARLPGAKNYMVGSRRGDSAIAGSIGYAQRCWRASGTGALYAFRSIAAPR